MIIIDRFEGDFAVCECDGKIINIKTELIEGGCAEGDCIEPCGSTYKKNDGITAKRKRRAAALLAKFRDK